MKQSHEDIFCHMREHFGEVHTFSLTETIPALNININVIPPAGAGDHLVLFTTGMSDRPQTVPRGMNEYRYTELFMRLPATWPTSGDAWRDDCYFWPYRWLRQIAFNPHENDSWLGGPCVIVSNDEPPEPLAPDTQQSCLLVFREPDDTGLVHCRDGRRIRLFSVFPLYEEERDLELRDGTYALLEALAETSQVYQADRLNVALK